KAAIVALSLSIGFGGGIACKELLDTSNSANASEAASVPVEKVQAPEPVKINRLIAPHLWDVYVDPLFTPVDWTLKPLSLLP
ncbi:hypothetical protein ABTE98_19825, partial [Acinetobacter baumannii]